MDLDVAALRRSLDDAQYGVDAVIERIGQAGQAGLGRNMTTPASVALGSDMDPLAVLIRLFLLQQQVPEAAVAALDVPELEAAGIIGRRDGGLRALVDLRPYASPDDGASGYLVSDLTPGMDTMTAPTRPDYVLGASPASLTLAQITPRRPVGSALDLGTGCGVQSLHLARHADRVVATDVNPRALELAGLTAALSGVEVDLRPGSLYDPVAGERFDLIVSNPPYVMAPPAEAGRRLTYREGDFAADMLVEQVVRGAAAHLTPGGHAQLLTNWAVVDGQDWQERLRGWVEDSGLDCLVLERERLDRFAYIEMWLTDAGLAGSPWWHGAYQAWLKYFEDLGIVEVGMGWILLTAAERRHPHLRFETWPHAVAQPTGDVFAGHRAAVDAAQLPLDELLGSRPRLVDTRQEMLGEPGAADPEHIVLRQQKGLLRAIRVGTLDGAVLGALDGELTLRQVIDAVASLVQAPVRDVEDEVVPVVRTALGEQFLVLGPG